MPSSCGTELEYSARATGHAVAVGRGTNILTSVAFSGAHEGLVSLCSPACIIITIIIFSIITITVISSVTNATGHAVAEVPRVLVLLIFSCQATASQSVGRSQVTARYQEPHELTKEEEEEEEEEEAY